MSREDFVAIGARIFAIYLLISTVKEVPGALQLLSQEYNVGWVVFYGLVLSVGLLASAFLWFFPLTVARMLLPVMREPRSEQAMNASIGMSVGLTLIGALGDGPCPGGCHLLAHPMGAHPAAWRYVLCLVA